MDKETLSNYGWIVICVLVLAVMLALATPFGSFVSDAVKSTTQGLFDVNQNALNSTGLVNIGDQSFDEGENGGTGGSDDAGDQGGSVLPAVGKTAEEYTWEEIKAISEAGKGDEYFNLGATKTFTTTDGTTIVMEIVSFNVDTKADGTTAGITWISKNIVAKYVMNSNGMNTNGWVTSEMRTWLQSEFYKTLPSELKDAIVTVNKTYYDYTTKSTLSCEDNVWIPSAHEVTHSVKYESFGADYSNYFPDNQSRVKYYNGTSTSWWLRSAYTNSDDGYISLINGDGYATTTTTSAGVVLGFCI